MSLSLVSHIFTGKREQIKMHNKLRKKLDVHGTVN